jgi:hypothetical protein
VLPRRLWVEIATAQNANMALICQGILVLDNCDLPQENAGTNF